MNENNTDGAMPEDGKKRDLKRTVLRLGGIVLAALLVLALIAAGAAKYYLGKIERYGAEDDYTMSEEEIRLMEEEIIRQEREEAAQSQTEAPTKTQTTPTEQTEASTQPPTDETAAPTEETVPPAEEEDYEVVNILLIGQDRRNAYERAQSDSMILCTIDKADNTVTMTSFLRDLYVQIPGYNDNRLNAAYPIGGMKLLDKALEVNFGVEVDANVEVDFAGFEAVVDAMGGVDIEMTEEEVEHLAEFYDYHHLVPGVNHLSGEEALAYSRIRYIDSDFQRSGRQRAVLAALIDSIRGANLAQLFSLMDTVLPLIKTDMTDAEILGYVMDFFPMLSDCRIVTQRIPLDDGFEYAEERGMSVIKAFPNMTRRLLEEITN